MTDEPVRVVLADDHTVVREGLRALLERHGDIRVVGEAATGREAVDLVTRLEPAIVLMDFAMPDMNGVEACRIIRERSPACRVLFLSMHEDESYFIQVFQAGAAGYLVKRSLAADICNAVLGTARGEVFLAPTLANALVRKMAAGDAAPAPTSSQPSGPAYLARTRDLTPRCRGADQPANRA